MKSITRQRIKNQKGFTLIEMLIVIALVGMVVMMLTSLFGNPFAGAATSGAATQIADQFRAVEGAAIRYQTEHTRPVSTITTLVNEGMMKMIPIPPVSAKEETATTGSYTVRLSKQYPTGTNLTGFGGHGIDTIVLLEQITADVCKEINYKFGVTDQGATPPASINYQKGQQCFGTSPNYTSILPVYTN